MERLESALSDIAAGQWGLVTAAQAESAGISRVRLSRLTNNSILSREAHGVYAVRAAGETEHQRLRVAWLSMDPARTAAERLGDGPKGIVVSHSSAASLQLLGDIDADQAEFTSNRRKQTRRADIVHHQAALDDSDITIEHGLPVTRPVRTVVDLLISHHDVDHVAGVLASAVRRRIIDLPRLTTRLGPLARRFGHPADDGQSLLEELLDLGGVADQVVADRIAPLAKHSHEVTDALEELSKIQSASRKISADLAKNLQAVHALELLNGNLANNSAAARAVELLNGNLANNSAAARAVETINEYIVKPPVPEVRRSVEPTTDRDGTNH